LGHFCMNPCSRFLIYSTVVPSRLLIKLLLRSQALVSLPVELLTAFAPRRAVAFCRNRGPTQCPSTRSRTFVVQGAVASL
jgi:hypothetical protein